MEIRYAKAANQPYWDPILGFCRRWTLPLALLALLIIVGLILWTIPVAFADTLSGRVVGVADGDTITVLGERTQHKIRLAGIDAPEMKQAFGNRAKQNLSDLVFDRWVTVEYDKRDRYGRIVGKVWVAPSDTCPNGTPACPRTLDVGLSQVQDGFAWHYKEYVKEQSAVDRLIYAESEDRAREFSWGLWLGPRPTPPWEWRREKRSQQ